MRILIFTHYFPPEVNAPASRIHENARIWAAQGCGVTVVTGAPNHPAGRLYPGYRNKLFQREIIDGIEVIRVWTFLAANQGFALRLLNYLSYLVAVAVMGWRLPDADVVISTSPQFFCGLAGALFQRRTRPWILEIRDLWPDSIVAVGASKRGAAIRLFERIEHWAYRRADRVVVVSPAFVGHIAAWRQDRSVDVIPNGVDLTFYTGDGARDAGDELRAELGLTGKFVAAYVGTHGMAHGLETILDAAEQLRDRVDIAFLLAGDGSERQALVKAARDRRLSNVHIIGQRSKSDMPALWSMTDASLVLLRDRETFRSVLPSKMFEAMGMSRPIVLGVEGEARRLLDAADAGIAIRPENASDLATAVCRLADDPALRARFGAAGQTYVREHYDRRALAARYFSLIADLVARRRA